MVDLALYNNTFLLPRGCRLSIARLTNFICLVLPLLLHNAPAYAQQHQLVEDGLEPGRYALDDNDSRHQATQHVIRADVHDIDDNNSPNRGNVSTAQINVWRYKQELLMGAYAVDQPGLPNNVSEVVERAAAPQHADLRKRQEQDVTQQGHEARQTSERVAYISVNTCSQPTWRGPGSQSEAPPQLTLYTSGPDNREPGPNSSGSQESILLEEGFAATSLQASSDIYLAIAAPSLSSDFTGGWTYDIAVSINNYYHQANFSVPFLYLVDTDTTSALLVTDNLTQANASDKTFKQWLNLTDPLPFTVFANDFTDTRRIGMSYSYCGLQNIKQIGGLDNTTASSSGPFVRTDMVTRGLGNKPKQQFLVGNLTRSTSYDVTLALVGNGVNAGKGVVGGGGTVWQPTTWTTKSDGNCQLLYDLPFCDEVAYAAPSNPSNFNTSALLDLYDTYASQLYANFSFSLQQISCDPSNDEKYSLARSCDDCARAYKQWLCAVTIPRCEDFSNNASFLQPRNVGQPFFQDQPPLSGAILNQSYQPMPGAPTLPDSPINQTWYSSFATNSSRNPAIIDDKIAPGPYKEVLPCEDLCYSLVQSCPAALQFSCPLPGRGLEVDYGKRPDSQTVIECSYLGAVYYIDDAGRLSPHLLLLFAVIGIAALLNIW